LAGIATLFNWALKRRELEIARQNRLSDQRIADDRNQEAALQAYLDRMGNLLAGLKLRSSEVESETRDLARAWTHAVVRKLDGERKGIVVRFLYESRLIDRFEPVIDISGADLRGANLCWANLIGVLLGSDRPVRGDLLERVAREIGGSVHHINGTDLTGADLGRASLHAAQLENVALENATLEWASLDGAVLTGAYCKGANLRHCSLTRANLRGCRLMGADLRDARLGSADLYGADLANANLSDADLR
jgi:hypothetical protein